MKKAIILGAIGSIVGFMLVVMLCWAVYCYIMPMLFPDAPANLINPSYWVFLGTVWLAKFIINILSPDK